MLAAREDPDGQRPTGLGASADDQQQRLRAAVGFLVGDLFHLPCEVEHHDWVPAGRDQAAMRASRGRLVADAVPERATLVFTHERFPAWGHIAQEPGGYRWERA